MKNHLFCTVTCRAEGSKENALATAKKMKSKGFLDADIAELTGLTSEELSKLL